MDILPIQADIRIAQSYIHDSLARMAMGQEPAPLDTNLATKLLQYRGWLGAEARRLDEANKSNQELIAREIQYLDDVAGEALSEWVQERARIIGRKSFPTDAGEIKIRALPEALEVQHEGALQLWCGRHLKEALSYEITVSIPETLSHDKKEAIVDAIRDAGLHFKERTKVDKRIVIKQIKSDGILPDGASLRVGARRLYLKDMTINERMPEVASDRQDLQDQGAQDAPSGDRREDAGGGEDSAPPRTLSDETLSALSGDHLQREDQGS